MDEVAVRGVGRRLSNDGSYKRGSMHQQGKSVAAISAAKNARNDRSFRMCSCSGALCGSLDRKREPNDIKNKHDFMPDLNVAPSLEFRL